MAIFFPAAFPPTVKEAVRAENSMPIIVVSTLSPPTANILMTIVAPSAPLTMPHISPITSAQILFTFSAFAMSLSAIVRLFEFFLAILKIISELQQVAATAIISKKILIIIKIDNKIKAIVALLFESSISDTKEKVSDKTKVKKNI